jgi:serine-type D-Ala-D-Ala carboxypeptidase (penicillin-binding protein 5/6)
MIVKSLVVLSIVLNLVGAHGVASKFDDAVIRDMAGSKKTVSASTDNVKLPEILPRPLIKTDSPKLNINAKYYYLADEESGAMIAGSNYKVRVPIASTTKIMSAIVILENYKLDEVVTVSTTASTQVGADAFLRPNEKITVINLLHCMLIKSGNDSAYALAEHMNSKKMSDSAGIVEPNDAPTESEGMSITSTTDATFSSTVKSFVDKMNEKAKELGMVDTHYEDPAGLDVTGYSSAYDLYVATKYAMKNEVFREIVAKQSYVAKNVDNTIYHELKNSNRLVAEYQYQGALGVKTGYMPEAGHCLVGAAKRNGHTFISVILSTYLDTPSASADESLKLLNWGFENVYWQ